MAPRTAAIVVLAALAVGTARDARAQEQDHRVVDGGPDRLLLTTGAGTFGLAYVSSAWVGATSSLDSDRALLVPFAGPWVALATRDGCEDSVACGAEPTYRTLLVGDGIVQAAGAAQIVMAFLFRERRPADEPRIRPGSTVSSLGIGPVRVRAGVGLGATGTF